MIRIVLPFVFVVSASAQEPAEEFREVRHRISQRVSRGELPSVAIAVSRGETVVWDEAFGWADREREVRATTDTPYAIASLSKSITATAVMILVDRGLLDLDLPVEHYLGAGRLRIGAGQADDVTLRRVIEMRAGIPHGWQVVPATATPRPVEQWLTARAPVAFPPGEDSTYSNLACAISEAVVARVAGTPFAEFVRQNLFLPLGMLDSSARLTDDLAGRAATKYQSNGDTLPPVHFQPAAAAGGFSTVRDLLRFGQFHLGVLQPATPVLSEAALDAMHAAEVGYFGFAHAHLDEGVHWWLTNGFIGGATSNLSIVPFEELVVAVLVNASGSPSYADRLASEIVEAAVPGFAKLQREHIERYEAAERLGRFRARPETTGEWRGVIETSGGDVDVLLTIGDGVAITVEGREPVAVTGLAGDASRLTGSCRLPLRNDVGHDAVHRVTLDLRVTGDEIRGAATSFFNHRGGSYAIPALVWVQRER